MNKDNEVLVAPIPSHINLKQEPSTEEAEASASIPTENVIDDPEDENLNCTFTARRKAAKRTYPWDLPAGELTLVPPPQAEDSPAAKKSRLEEPCSASADVATANTAPADAAVVALAATTTTAAAAANADHADADSVKGTRSTGHWTQEEVAILNIAVANTCKKKYGKEYRTDWAAVAALVPGRTRNQCDGIWNDALNMNGRTGKWTEDEDSKLKDAVQTHGDKDWVTISALVPSRTKKQCYNKWHDSLDPSIDRKPEHTGTWTEDEDIKLKNAVQTHGGKNWGAIAALVPGREGKQCWKRWHYVLKVNGRAGTWTEDEDIKLKDAVQTHGDKNWGAIAALVPGRAEKECWSRWNDALDLSIGRANGCTGIWTKDEDIKLKDAVQTNCGNNWAASAALVLGRTKSQCRNRYYRVLDPTIDQVTGRKGKWAAEEDIKLKNAVQTHGGKNWGAIAALVPDRTTSQCHNRWQQVLDPISIDQVIGRTGSWTKDEDTKLKAAVQTHGGNNWGAITALVPSRTKKQCYNRWQQVLDLSIDRASGRTGRWAEEEDSKLKDAVHTNGGKNWSAIAALVPGRTQKQCCTRWHDTWKAGSAGRMDVRRNGQKTKSSS
jgi:hypothetical protein